MNLNAAWQGLREVLSNPASNLTAATLLAAAVALVILIVAVLVLLLLLPKPDRPRIRPLRRNVPRPEEVGGEGASAPPVVAAKAARIGPRARLWIAVGLFAMAAASAYVITGSDGYCANACHSRDRVGLSRAATAHPKTACAACHEDGLPAGIAGNIASRIGHAVLSATGGANAYTTAVPAGRCLPCHRAIAARTTVNTVTHVRMSHKEPLNAGMTCADCHAYIGHGPKSSRVSMSSCIRCHDGRRASSGCQTCHVGDTGVAATVTSQRLYTTVELGPVKDCGGCHDQKPCDACHGLRLPHSDAFVSGGHARFAGFQKKVLCYHCHATIECGKCHGEFDKAHGGLVSWRIAHQKEPRSSPCNTCHSRHTGSMCATCH